EFENMTGAATRSDLCDESKNHVLSRNTGLQASVEIHSVVFRFALQQALGREHHLYFARSNAMRQRAERAVCGCVAVATNESTARLRESKLRTYDVNDSLPGTVQIVQGHSEFSAVLGQCPDLIRSHFIKAGKRSAGSRNGMVHRRESSVGPAYFETAFLQS